jgi:hypothetical protein
MQFFGNENIISNDQGKTNVSNSNLDFTEQLLNLAKLKEEGILTQEEFEEQKRKILNSK